MEFGSGISLQANPGARMIWRLILLFLLSLPGKVDAQRAFQLAPPLIRYPSVFFERELLVGLDFAQPGARIHYTLDGSLPTEADAVYTQPILIREARVTVQARSFAPGFLPSAVSAITFIRQGLPVRSVAGTSPDPKYPGNGLPSLIDNRGGILHTGSPTWIGYQVDHIELEVELDRPENVQSVLLHFLENQGSWIFMPEQIEVWAYDDLKKEYVSLGRQSFPPGITASAQPSCRPVLVPAVSPQQIHKLKLVIQVLKKIPDGHPAQGQHAWAFIDEIKIY